MSGEIEQEPEFSLPSISNSEFISREDDGMEVVGQTRNEPAEMHLRSRRVRLVLEGPAQNRMLMEEDDNRTDDDYHGEGEGDDDDDDVPTVERFSPFWLSQVSEVRFWYDSHGKMWPSATTEDWGYTWTRELSLARFLRRMRRGARALQSGSTDETALQGMTDDKLEYLDTRLPGWFDGEDHWTPLVDRICEWKSLHGTLPRPLLKIVMYMPSFSVNLSGMTEEEMEEIELGEFLGLHRRLRSTFLGKRDYRFTSGSQFLQRLLILDERIPKWYIVEDQWDELFADLRKWKSENVGPSWPRLFKDIVSKIMSGKEVPKTIIRESRLAMFIERQKSARFLRHGRKVQHGLTRQRERLLLSEVPDVFSARIVKVKVKNGVSRHPFVQKANEIAEWRENNSGRFPRSVIFDDQGVATPDADLLEEQKEECALGGALMELRAARNRAVYMENRDGLESDLEDELEGILPGWRYDIQDD